MGPSCRLSFTIQLFSLYAGSQRLRGACLRAATTPASVSSSVTRQPSIGLATQLPRASGYQCTSSASTRGAPSSRLRDLRQIEIQEIAIAVIGRILQSQVALPAVVHGPEHHAFGFTSLAAPA